MNHERSMFFTGAVQEIGGDPRRQRGVVIETFGIADVDNLRGCDIESLADHSVELRDLLDGMEIRGGGEDVGEAVAEVELLEFDVDELAFRVGADDERVVCGEAGEDHGYVRIAGDMRTVLIKHGAPVAGEVEAVEPVGGVVPLEALVADPVVFREQLLLRSGEVFAGGLCVEPGQAVEPDGVCERRRGQGAVKVEGHDRNHAASANIL